jgi:hypothetical protein
MQTKQQTTIRAIDCDLAGVFCIGSLKGDVVDDQGSIFHGQTLRVISYKSPLSRQFDCHYSNGNFVYNGPNLIHGVVSGEFYIDHRGVFHTIIVYLKKGNTVEPVELELLAK